MEMFLQILTAVGVSGLVAALVSYYNGAKRNQMDGIVAERTAWRREIREIADGLQKTDFGEAARQQLEKLTLRINPNGLEEEKNYKNDGHIWPVIEKMETQLAAGDEEGYKQNRKLLNRLLSALLKADWERAKGEILGNAYRRWVWVALMMGCAADTYITATEAFPPDKLYLAVFNVVIYLIMGLVTFWMLSLKLVKVEKGKANFWKRLGISALQIGLVFIYVVVFVLELRNFYSFGNFKPQMMTSLIVKGMVLVITVCIGLRYMIVGLREKKDYGTLVEEIMAQEPAGDADVPAKTKAPPKKNGSGKPAAEKAPAKENAGAKNAAPKAQKPKTTARKAGKPEDRGNAAKG